MGCGSCGTRTDLTGKVVTRWWAFQPGFRGRENVFFWFSVRAQKRGRVCAVRYASASASACVTLRLATRDITVDTRDVRDMLSVWDL
jgi:hypothetical protein